MDLFAIRSLYIHNLKKKKKSFFLSRTRRKLLIRF